MKKKEITLEKLEHSIFTIPTKLDEDSVFSYLNALKTREVSQEIFLDFSEVDFSYPFGMLVLASELKDYIQKNKIQIVKVNLDYRKQVYHYLGHIGFFQFLGINKGNDIGQATANNNYLPITILKRDLLEIDPKNGQLGPAVQKESEKLTKVILNLERSGINHPLAYCFREVIRNVFEHSESDECLVCAQKWRDGSLEIAILDRGIGIRKSLEKKFPKENNFETLKLAIEPGVSKANVYDEANDDVWANSGFGLYVLSEICKKTGSFILASGESALAIKDNEISEKPYSFHGTAVYLKMNRPKGKNVSDFIKEIIARGEEIAKSKTGRSKASKITKTI